MEPSIGCAFHPSICRSVFGSLLDREAGLFRLGPSGTNVPAARWYEPGTNTVITTWRAATGWIVVRDSLTIGPRGDREDSVTVHTRPPADVDADHLLVRTVECTEGEVEVELICGPIFDYGREAGEWNLDDGTPFGRRLRRRRHHASSNRHVARHRGSRARAQHTLRQG